MEQPTGKPLQIGRVATRTGLSVDTIRFYERRSLLRSAVRSAGGFRLFHEDDVQDLFFIERAQEMGFSLDEIAELLSLRANGKACRRVQRLLETKVDVVSRKIRDLQRLKRELAESLEECNGALAKRAGVERCPVLKGIAAKGAAAAS